LGKPVPEGKAILGFTEAEMKGWQWHQLDNMQVICTSFRMDNHASTSSLSFYGLDALPAMHHSTNTVKTLTNKGSFSTIPLRSVTA